MPLAVAPYGQPQLSFAPTSLSNIESIDVVRGGGAVRDVGRQDPVQPGAWRMAAGDDRPQFVVAALRQGRDAQAVRLRKGRKPAARQQPAPDYDSFDDDIPF